MRGASIGHSHSRPCFVRKTLRRCRNSDEDDVIFIDVDPDDFGNVIIIDVPDSLPKKQQRSRILKEDRTGPLQTVIYIDDDESSDTFNSSCDDENPDKFSSFAGTSSSRGSKPPMEDFEDLDAEENPFIQEIITPVRLSKCKRTYSGKASAGKAYGLKLDLEKNLSANDHPDCELMEDSSGKVQEQWEKAFYRRKKGNKYDQSGIRSQNGASKIMNDSCHEAVGRKDENDKRMESPYCFDTGIFSNEVENTFPLHEVQDAYYDKTYVSVVGSSNRGLHSSSIHAELEDHQFFKPGSSKSHNRKRLKKSSSYSSDNERATKEVKKTRSCVDGNSDSDRASSVKDDVTISKGQNSVEAEAEAETEAEPANFFPTNEFWEPQVVASGCVNEAEHLESRDPVESGSVEKTYNLTSVRSPFMSSVLPDKQRNCSFTPSSDAVETSWLPLSGNIHVNINDAQGMDESVSDSGEEYKDDDFHPENGRGVYSVESCIIGEREKFKETDEYKRAIEEEWASRQQALKIQAEEAQHLRRLQKRRKTESMRLMDMERRQKERIEEMRSIQKKDEENMNLKEVIRSEVRKELSRLEMVCQNMASLLHSFGIQIEGWPIPSQQEVQTAYKKALLTFHPDRALRGDIRQRVEAEEKFKLMSRFKEKFSSVL